MRDAKAKPRVGPILLAIAVIHFAVTPLFYADGARAVLDHGLVNGVESGTDLLQARAAAFWYVVAGLFLLLFGYLCWSVEAQGRRLPVGLGWLLLAATLVAAVLTPVSGFWLFLIPATVILLTELRGRRSSGASGSVAGR